MGFMSTRAVDVGLVCAFLAASFSAWSTETAWRQAIAIGLAAAAAGVAYLSSGPGIWLRKVHLAVSDSPGTGIRHVRKVGAKLPTPYPDAWYSVALTETLPPGMALPVTVCNINLVVWRPELKAGESAWPAPVVMDAYCTHLGAHLALGGGRIEGDCIRCPFHGWQFDASGKLRAVPESDTCPTNADMKTWPSMEKNSVVSVWMSSQIHKRAPVTDDEVARLDARVGAFQLNGDATPAPARAPSEALKRVDIEYEPTTVASKCEGRTDAVQSSGDILPQRRQLNRPWFTIPTFDQLNGPNKWKFHGYTENIVNAVLFEIPENGSDVAHLPALHREFVIPSLTWAFSHQWAATWNGTPTGPRSHVADITVKEAIALFDRTLPGEVNVNITQCGPTQVFLSMTTPVGTITIVETVTPVAPMQLRVIHAVYAPEGVPSVFAKIVMLMTLIQFEKDVPVWCNKRYECKPNLTKADKSIPVYRRWITQFNTPDAVTFEEAAKAHIRDELGLPSDATLDW